MKTYDFYMVASKDSLMKDGMTGNTISRPTRFTKGKYLYGRYFVSRSQAHTYSNTRAGNSLLKIRGTFEDDTVFEVKRPTDEAGSQHVVRVGLFSGFLAALQVSERYSVRGVNSVDIFLMSHRREVFDSADQFFQAMRSETAQVAVRPLLGFNGLSADYFRVIEDSEEEEPQTPVVESRTTWDAPPATSLFHRKLA